MVNPQLTRKEQDICVGCRWVGKDNQGQPVCRVAQSVNDMIAARNGTGPNPIPPQVLSIVRATFSQGDVKRMGQQPFKGIPSECPRRFGR